MSEIRERIIQAKKTECCHAPLEADERFCPKCGWECRAIPALLSEIECVRKEPHER